MRADAVRREAMILLDTHCAVWLVTRPQRLSRSAAAAIRRAQAGGALAIASVTLMEMAVMLADGDIQPTGTPQAWLRGFLERTAVVPRDVTAEIAAVAACLPPRFPLDPFDRLIAATAIVERMPLVTADGRIQKSGVVKTIW
jgi:PIN domain nuclease of toxin-antitoxin system